MSVSIGDLAFAFGETLYMTLLSTLVAYAIGLPIGIGLIITDKNGLRPMRVLNAVLGIIVNILRSIPDTAYSYNAFYAIHNGHDDRLRGDNCTADRGGCSFRSAHGRIVAQGGRSRCG